MSLPGHNEFMRGGDFHSARGTFSPAGGYASSRAWPDVVEEEIRRAWGRLDALSPDLSELFMEQLRRYGDAMVARALAESLEQDFLAANFGPYADIQHLGKRLLRAGQPNLAEELRNLIGRGYAESPRTRTVIREEFEARLADDTSPTHVVEFASARKEAASRNVRPSVNADTAADALGGMVPGEGRPHKAKAPAPAPRTVKVPEARGTGKRLRRVIMTSAVAACLVAILFAVSTSNGFRKFLSGETQAKVATLDLQAPPVPAPQAEPLLARVVSALSPSQLLDTASRQATGLADVLNLKDVFGVKPVEAAQSGSTERRIGKKVYYDRLPTL